MKKTFCVSVDITMATSISVMAETEDEAMDKANQMLLDNPYGYTNNFSHYVDHNVVCAEEED